ncbi:MAG: hypothetical protein ACI3YH_03185 [Eubacteriales bacterium]
MMKLNFDLQYFAEGGAASGAAEAVGTVQSGNGKAGGTNGDNGDKVKVIYGKQATEDPASDTETQTQKEQTADKAAQFRALIDGEYKDEYTKLTQQMINRRFKETKTTEESLKGKLSAVEPLLELLKVRYNTEDEGQLTELLKKDNAIWQDAADEMSMTTPQYMDYLQLKMRDKRLAQIEQNADAQKKASAQYQQWMSEAMELKAKYPAFDLNQEVQNETFARLLKAGVPMDHAFKVAHYDEFLDGTVQRVQQQTADNVVANVRARGARPAEAGAKRSSGVVYKSDPNTFTKEDRAEVVRQMKEGKVFNF